MFEISFLALVEYQRAYSFGKASQKIGKWDSYESIISNTIPLNVTGRFLSTP